VQTTSGAGFPTLAEVRIAFEEGDEAMGDVGLRMDFGGGVGAGRQLDDDSVWEIQGLRRAIRVEAF